jgi:hypothetical protein
MARRAAAQYLQNPSGIEKLCSVLERKRGPCKQLREEATFIPIATENGAFYAANCISF